MTTEREHRLPNQSNNEERSICTVPDQGRILPRPPYALPLSVTEMTHPGKSRFEGRTTGSTGSGKPLRASPRQFFSFSGGENYFGITMDSAQIDFDLRGVVRELNERLLAVPIYPRSYAWSNEEISDGMDRPCSEAHLELWVQPTEGAWLRRPSHGHPVRGRYQTHATQGQMI